jgi:hypothetical protein
MKRAECLGRAISDANSEVGEFASGVCGTRFVWHSYENMHLTGVHLMGMHLMGMHLAGMHLVNMHLTDFMRWIYNFRN